MRRSAQGLQASAGEAKEGRRDQGGAAPDWAAASAQGPRRSAWEGAHRGYQRCSPPALDAGARYVSKALRSPSSAARKGMHYIRTSPRLSSNCIYLLHKILPIFPSC
jgi:hypothetical protein